MSKPKIVEHFYDVVVAGGGLAGCSAAIRAGELNDKVVLVDKSNPKRSGCAATGVDHTSPPVLKRQRSSDPSAPAVAGTVGGGRSAVSWREIAPPMERATSTWRSRRSAKRRS